MHANLAVYCSPALRSSSFHFGRELEELWTSCVSWESWPRHNDETSETLPHCHFATGYCRPGDRLQALSLPLLSYQETLGHKRQIHLTIWGKFLQPTIESSFLRLSWRYPSYKNSWLSWKARTMAEYFVSRCPIIGHHPWYNSSTNTVPPAPALVRMHSTPTALELMSTIEQPLGLAGLSANTQSTN